MVDHVDGASFIEKARGNLRVGCILGMQDLDRHASTNGLLDGLKNGPHATFTKLALDLIWTYAFESHSQALTCHYITLSAF
jgi:hypothetical protein